MSYWVNGQPCQQISVSDRAVAFGDGCFTTIHGVNQQAQMLKEHIARLTRDCLRLKITAPDWGELEHHLTEICTQQVDEEFVLKVIISRGVGGRGYSSIGFTQPTIIVSVSPFPSHYTQLQCQGCKCILAYRANCLYPCIIALWGERINETKDHSVISRESVPS